MKPADIYFYALLNKILFFQTNKVLATTKEGESLMKQNVIYASKEADVHSKRLMEKFKKQSFQLHGT